MLDFSRFGGAIKLLSKITSSLTCFKLSNNLNMGILDELERESLRGSLMVIFVTASFEGGTEYH